MEGIISSRSYLPMVVYDVLNMAAGSLWERFLALKWTCLVVVWQKFSGSSENPIFEIMELSDKKLHLIARLMQVRKHEILEQLEELLIRAEMEARADESLKAIEKNDVVSLDGFTESNQSWIQKSATK